MGPYITWEDEDTRRNPLGVSWVQDGQHHTRCAGERLILSQICMHLRWRGHEEGEGGFMIGIAGEEDRKKTLFRVCGRMWEGMMRQKETA